MLKIQATRLCIPHSQFENHGKHLEVIYSGDQFVKSVHPDSARLPEELPVCFTQRTYCFFCLLLCALRVRHHWAVFLLYLFSTLTSRLWLTDILRMRLSKEPTAQNLLLWLETNSNPESNNFRFSYLFCLFILKVRLIFLGGRGVVLLFLIIMYLKKGSWQRFRKPKALFRPSANQICIPNQI